MGLFIGNNKYKVMVGNQKCSFVTKDSLLPAGYVQLEWIESTGTQYINTGIQPDEKFAFTMSVIREQNTGLNGIWGCRSGTMDSRAYNIGSTVSNNIRLNICNINTTVDISNIYGKVLFEYNSSVFRMNNVSYPVQGIKSLCPHPFLLFGWNNMGSINARASIFESFTAFYDGEKIQDLIPCINPNNEVGMYDLVTQSFFKSPNDAAFIAGPVVNN